MIDDGRPMSQKMVYSIDVFLVMMVVMVHDSLGGSGGSARLPHRLKQGTPYYVARK